MSTSIFILLLVQIILIILNAIFASAEIAVLSMNETKLERMAEQGNGRAKRLVRLTQEPALPFFKTSVRYIHYIL